MRIKEHFMRLDVAEMTSKSPGATAKPFSTSYKASQ